VSCTQAALACKIVARNVTLKDKPSSTAWADHWRRGVFAKCRTGSLHAGSGQITRQIENACRQFAESDKNIAEIAQAIERGIRLT
jgi:hypothetical protein